MKKNLMLLTLICAIFLVSTVAYADTGVQIEVNGERVDFSENTGIPFVDEASRTQIPVKVVLERLGVSIGWDGERKEVIASNETSECLIPIGKKMMIINGETQTTDTSALIKKGRTFIPIKQVAEALGYHVSWDAYKRAVYIYDDSHVAYYEDVLNHSSALLEQEKQAEAMATMNEEAWYINKQGTMIIENNDYIFFILDRTDGSYISDVYKQSKKTGKITRFKNAATSGGLYANDQYVVNLDVDYYNIEKIDIETGKKTVLVTDVDTRPMADQCLLVGDWFYYSNLKTSPYEPKYDDAFSRVNINTGEIQVIDDIIASNMRYWDGHLLYTIDSPVLEDIDDFHFLDLATMKEDRIMTNESGLYLPTTIVDNKMFLACRYDGPKVYWTDLTADTYKVQTLETVLENPCVNTDALLAYKGDVYMLGDDSFNDKYHIYKQNLATGDYKDIVLPIGYHTRFMNIVNDKIYIYSTENVNYHIVGCHVFSMDLDGNNLQTVK